MKFIPTLLACFAVAHAQRVAIGSPPDQAMVSAGQQMVVEVDRPNFLSSAQEVSVVIGIQSCAATPCAAPNRMMGQILYSGGFDPQPDAKNTSKPPHQNFTVTLPSNLQKGSAQIGVAHFSLIGAGLEPFMETKNVSVIVQ
ncbi:hypothetical protein D9756_005305 [Leucocoprinus leucothites]|uniref:Uncharacterized protein n=1 Tax=Leucocoprinus leucothites TaxID=201217 RepID=A0A8H5D7A6_9AGAR|nr:hypothetical protein D9756_005305 [Leucoagaricus leucothites]